MIEYFQRLKSAAEADFFLTAAKVDAQFIRQRLDRTVKIKNERFHAIGYLIQRTA